jgi:hypothetical protein
VNLLAALLTLAVLAAAIAIVSGPLRRPPGVGTPVVPRLAELEAEREAKYREIRDLELDYRTGKLSWEDYEATNEALRGEAVKILDELQALGADVAPVSGPGPLEQDDRVGDKQDGEEDRPAVEVPLDERPATQRARSATHAESARET